jgi:hypothetical protein
MDAPLGATGSKYTHFQSHAIQAPEHFNEKSLTFMLERLRK